MAIRGQEFHSIIENVFGEVQGLMQSEQVQVNCPMCQERDGLSEPDGKFNLEINTARRQFRCWKCDEPRFSGSLGRLVRTFGSDADYQMYKSYAGSYYEYDYEEDEKEYAAVKLPEEMILFSQMEVGNLEHFEAYNYIINNRKITRDIVLKYRLGFCTTGKYEKRIIIPSYDANGEVNYFVGRTYDPKEKKRKYLNPNVDKNKFIFNEGLINWDSSVFIVEGVFDMLSLPNAIPLLGKTLSVTLYDKIKQIKPKIIVVLDPDAWNNEMNIYNTLQLIYDNDDKNILALNLKGKYDIDETRKFLGQNEVIKLLYNARKLNDDDYFNRKINNEKTHFRKFYNKSKFNS